MVRLDGDLLPHGSTPRRPASEQAPARRPPRRTRNREIAFGIALAIVATIVIVWWNTSAREPHPSLVEDSTPTAVGSPSTNISGGPAPSTVPGGNETPPATTTNTTRSTLLSTYDAMHNVYQASRSYQTISLGTLGQLLPGITIEDGSASSTNDRVVSLLTPAADRVVLAVRDDAGCAWLRDFGGGAQIVDRTNVVITCSARAAPATGWQTG